MHRVGLLIPSSNTVMEPDCHARLGAAATVHAARMYLEDPLTRAGGTRLLDEYARPAARDIGSLRPDVVVFGCTSAGSLRGAEADRDLRAELGELADAPVIGVLDAVGVSLRALGVSRISLFTPYRDELNDSIVASLVQDGYEVANAAGLGCAGNIEIGRVEPARIVAAASAATAADSEALVISCTNFRALEVREQIERTIGVPVVTANSAVTDRVRERLEGLV